VNRLDDHLRQWLGAWPPRTTLDVVGTPARTAPGWDGQVRPFLGVEAPGLGTVVSVAPTRVDDVRALVDGQATLTPPLRGSVARLLGGGTIAAGAFRHAGAVPDPDVLPDVGTWVVPDDPRIPPWLRPFNGGVLLAFDDTGAYAAGVGVKRHDDIGHELSVGTDPRHRGRGLARRLVAQAARHLLGNGGVVTYLHAPDNVASARVADAAGFPDRGWRVWGLFREETP
jgi:GNAT superfamily N-acetyltransferase